MAKSSREVRRILAAHGDVVVRRRGSHEQWQDASGVTVTVAGGGKGGQTVPVGTLRSIRRATGIEGAEMSTVSETYTLIAEQADDGGWGVHAVELPGVVSFGPTRGQAFAAWDEALALHAEAGPLAPRRDVFVERRTVTRTA